MLYMLKPKDIMKIWSTNIWWRKCRV